VRHASNQRGVPFENQPRKPILRELTGMGLRKEDNELREALNKAFAEMRADGTYEKLAKKYFDFDVYGG
ncbi:transporter substrate-binding domain-containing protein, partial [Escherichia sp. TWPC-MK]